MNVCELFFSFQFQDTQSPWTNVNRFTYWSLHRFLVLLGLIVVVVHPHCILWTARWFQEFWTCLGLCVTSWALWSEASLDSTRNSYMAKEGDTGCTRDSCSLAAVGSKRKDNQSWPDRSRTLLPWLQSKWNSTNATGSLKNF